MSSPTDFPTWKLELDTSPSGGTTRTWQDITTYMRGFTVDYGRNFELDTFQPGTHTYTLDNTTGRFRMFNTTGAYYPNLKAWRRVRLSCTWKSVVYYLAYGYLQSIVPTRQANYDEVQMTCWDALAILAQRALIPTVQSVTTTTGVANGDLTFTSKGGVSGLPSFGGGGRGLYIGGPAPGQLQAATTQGGIVVQYVAGASDGYPPVATYSAGVVTVNIKTPPALASAIRDAVNVGCGGIVTAANAPGSNASAHVGTGSWTMTGGFSAQRSDLRVGAVLNLIGWPSGDRLIGTGTDTIQSTQFVAADDIKALQHLQDVTLSELGQLYADGQNRIVFQGQTARAGAPFSTPSCVLSDSPGVGEYDYADLVPLEDNTRIYNNIIGSINGGAGYTATSASSITDFNQADFSYQTILSSAVQLQTNTNKLLTAYSAQKLRYDKVLLQPQNSDGLWDYVVDNTKLGISNQVTVKEHPPGSAALSTNCFIERVSYTCDMGAGDPYVFTAQYQLSPAN